MNGIQKHMLWYKKVDSHRKGENIDVVAYVIDIPVFLLNTLIHNL